MQSTTPDLGWLIVLGILPMVLPVLMVLGRVLKAKPKWQFGVFTLFTFTTVTAIACGIARLPLNWMIKLAVLWSFLLCVLGWIALRFGPRR